MVYIHTTTDGGHTTLVHLSNSLRLSVHNEARGNVSCVCVCVVVVVVSISNDEAISKQYV